MTSLFSIHSLVDDLLAVVYSFTNHYEKHCIFPLVCKKWQRVANNHPKRENLEEVFLKCLHKKPAITTQKLIQEIFQKNKMMVSLIESDDARSSSFSSPGKMQTIQNLNSQHKASYSDSVSFSQPMSVIFDAKSNKIFTDKESVWKTYRVHFQYGTSLIILTMNECDVVLRKSKVFIVPDVPKSIEQKGVWKWQAIKSHETSPPGIDQSVISALNLSIKAQIKWISRINADLILSKMGKLERFEKPYFFSTNQFGCIRTKESNKVANFFSIYLIELMDENKKIIFKTLACRHEVAIQNLKFSICWAVVIKTTKILTKAFQIEVTVDPHPNQE